MSCRVHVCWAGYECSVKCLMHRIYQKWGNDKWVQMRINERTPMAQCRSTLLFFSKIVWSPISKHRTPIIIKLPGHDSLHNSCNRRQEHENCAFLNKLLSVIFDRFSVFRLPKKREVFHHKLHFTGNYCLCMEYKEWSW